MGKIYKNQAFKLYLNTKLTSLEFGTIASAVIKYRQPDAIEDSVTGDISTYPYIIHEVANDEFDIAGEWVVWVYLTMVDGSTMPGEIDTLKIYDEGYK